MIRLISVCLLLALLAGVVSAQNEEPTVTPGIPQRPTSTPAPDDPRLNVCTAPTLRGFEPYMIRPGDTLGALLADVPNISVTQLAALNCIDDPAVLPVGAVIWVPMRILEGEAGTSEGDSDEPEILYLRADAEMEDAQNQAGVVFRWEAAGETAYFYACPADESIPCERPSNARPVPLAFTTLPIRGFLYAGPVRYRLEVVGGDETITEDVTVEITCSQEWLGQSTGEQPCPQVPPRALFAAWQPFENGAMLWFSDTQQIWVLTDDDHRVQIFDDLYMEGAPDPEAEAPDGLYTPTRGFGRVWEELGGPDSDLGWATTPEIGFDSARQPASTRSYTTYILGPDTIIYAFTVIPQLDLGFWTQLEE